MTLHSPLIMFRLPELKLKSSLKVNGRRGVGGRGQGRAREDRGGAGEDRGGQGRTRRVQWRTAEYREVQVEEEELIIYF